MQKSHTCEPTIEEGWKICQDCGIYLPASKNQCFRENNPTCIKISHQSLLKNYRENSDYNRGFNPSATYLKYRKILIDWICEVGESLHLSLLTIQTAASLYDSLLSTKEFSKPLLQPIGLIALLVAAKSEEGDENVPRFHQLVRFTQNSVATLKRLELELLTTLKWQIVVVTPLHFIYFYTSHGVVFINDAIGASRVNERTASYVRKYAEFFADLALQEHEFIQFSAENIACACIAGARKVVGIFNIWPAELEEMTGKKLENTCFGKLWKNYQESFVADGNSKVKQSKENKENVRKNV
ncbi:CCNJL_4 [Blepharisma stoltei]|uniref:Cyclin-like domain-containing protein n=1 Tax=Blepharisma stoltei TaxID=1481888 RepID=A0AAU9K8C3_9CILI|nr:unnamed protein product [Blepharisma stoltei]